MIVKIQKPLQMNMVDTKAFVCNENREYKFFTPMTKELDEHFGYKYKIFADVKVSGDNMKINKILPDQGW